MFTDVMKVRSVDMGCSKSLSLKEKEGGIFPSRNKVGRTGLEFFFFF